MKPLTAIIALLVCISSAFAQLNIGNRPGGGVTVVQSGVITWVMTNNPTVTARSIHITTNSLSSVCIIKLPPNLPSTNQFFTYIHGSTTNVTTNLVSWVGATNAMARAVAGSTVTTGWGVITMGPGDAYMWDSATLWSGGLIAQPIGSTNALVEWMEDSK
jgi:multisubunit Na+/H+ antiporter MnhB subunit